MSSSSESDNESYNPIRCASTCDGQGAVCVVCDQTFHSKTVDFSKCHGKDIIYRIRIANCIFHKFPNAQSLNGHLYFLTKLNIVDSTLSHFTKENLKGLGILGELKIEFCDIEHLPGNLFEHTQSLEVISFKGNKIKHIDGNILDPLTWSMIKEFDLSENVCIDICYTKLNETTFEEFKEAIEICSPNYGALKTQKRKIAELEERFELEKTKFARLEAGYSDLEKKFEAFIKQSIQEREMLKNFTIKLETKEFKVHKAVLVTKSATLAKLIEEFPEADSYILPDISEETFKEVLNFLYGGNLPSSNSDVNLIELFIASHQLQIDALLTATTNMLIEKVNPITALDVLILCNNYKTKKELKLKAFEEFQKNFPGQILLPLLASKPEKLTQLMKVKTELDQTITAAHEEDNSVNI